MSDMKEIMAKMHEALANDLLKKIKDGAATAADLSVARAMLKDNGVTSLPDRGTLGSLTDEMEHSEGGENVLPFAVR